MKAKRKIRVLCSALALVPIGLSLSHCRAHRLEQAERERRAEYRAERRDSLGGSRERQREVVVRGDQQAFVEEELALWQGTSLDSLSPRGAWRRLYRRAEGRGEVLSLSDSLAEQAVERHSAGLRAEHREAERSEQSRHSSRRGWGWLREAKWVLFALIALRLLWLYQRTRRSAS